MPWFSQPQSVLYTGVRLRAAPRKRKSGWPACLAFRSHKAMSMAEEARQGQPVPAVQCSPHHIFSQSRWVSLGSSPRIRGTTSVSSSTLVALPPRPMV